MKYLIATSILVISLFLGWLISAKFLDPLIHTAFNPKNHDEYISYWFATFVAIEAIIFVSYVAVVIWMFRAKKGI